MNKPFEASRRAFGFEPLEDRATPTVSTTAAEQLMIELINRARRDPVAEAARFGIALNEGVPTVQQIGTSAKAPLAPNDLLRNAIRGHLSFLLTDNKFQHESADGKLFSTRIPAAGYTDHISVGENLAYHVDPNPIMEADQVTRLHRELFVDQGIPNRSHRVIMLSELFKEIGSGLLVGGPYQPPGSSSFPQAALVGQDFAARNDDFFLTGVAYTDAVVNDSFYTVGEGLGNVTITARRSDGMEFTTTTGAAGGYSVQLPAGAYTVTTSGSAQVAPITVNNVVIDGKNVKQDFTPAMVVTAPLTLAPFLGPNDSVGVGSIATSSVGKSLFFYNNDPANGDSIIQPVNPLTFRAAGTTLTTANLDLNGWSDASDVTLVGDTDSDGVADIIQFNRPATAGANLTGPLIRVVDSRNAAAKKTINASDSLGGPTYGSILANLLDPNDRVFVGYFTQKTELEALFFNRSNVAGEVAVLTVNLVTGVTGAGYIHDGIVFGGWVDADDETVVADTNFDGFDDLAFVNRVANPQDFRTTSIGFVGMVSLNPQDSGIRGNTLGFYRFFDWNFAKPGEQSVFPGYDDRTDRMTVGRVVNNGRTLSALVLVNSSTTVQAAFAVLEPAVLVQGVRDSFQLISTIFHSNATTGFFDPEDTFVLGDFNGDKTDELASFSKAGAGAVRVFGAFSGAPMTASASRPQTVAPSVEIQDATNVIDIPASRSSRSPKPILASPLASAAIDHLLAVGLVSPRRAPQPGRLAGWVDEGWF